MFTDSILNDLPETMGAEEALSSLIVASQIQQKIEQNKT